MPQIEIKDMVRGDSYGITINFADKAKVPINIEGRTLTFTVKSHWSQSDEDAVIQKVVELTAPDPSAQSGQAYILLDPAETSITPGKYHYDVQMVNGTVVTTIMRGDLNIVGDVTRSA